MGFNNRKIILYIVLMIAVCVTAYVLLVAIPARVATQAYDGAKRIGKDIRDAFQVTPEITINNTIILQQQADVFELAMLSQQFQHEYDWKNTWMGSTKKIMIKGTFEAKAGFDLEKVFKIDITEDKAIVTLPQPELLSLTPRHDFTFKDEQGIWNWVSPDDRTRAINAFTKDAHRYADHADFINRAKDAMEKKLKEILQSHGKTVEIQYQLAERVQPLR